MVSRVASLVMALAIALCPAVLDVCRVLCAGHESAPAAAHEHQHHSASPVSATPDHHAHHAAPAASAESTPVAVRSVTHECAHDGTLSVFLGQQVQLAPGPAVAATGLASPPLPSRVVPRADADPPDLSQRTALTRQLRV